MAALPLDWLMRDMMFGWVIVIYGTGYPLQLGLSESFINVTKLGILYRSCIILFFLHGTCVLHFEKK